MKEHHLIPTVEQLSILTPREQTILRLRLGLGGGKSHTLEEVGRHFDVSRERIRQIEIKALKKLELHIRPTTTS